MADILARVADPQLRATPCLRVAWAIVEGRLPGVRLARVLRQLDDLRGRRELTTAAGAYFCGSMKRIFRELGIPWEKPR